MSSTYPHNMVNFGIVAAEIGLPVWGTPANFNGFRILAALLLKISLKLARYGFTRPCLVEVHLIVLLAREAVLREE